MGTTSPNPSPTLGWDPDPPLRAAGARICAPALHGKPANSQLAPERSAFADKTPWPASRSSLAGHSERRLVENTGLEPATS